MLSHCADALIDTYQRYISPYKGFRCAYHVHTGRRSCSAYARVIVRRLGAFALFSAMPRQLRRCRAAYNAILVNRNRRSRQQENRKKKDRDFSDCIPSDCDLPCHLSGKVHHCDTPCDLDVGPCDCSL